jgi:hypothetical protein
MSQLKRWMLVGGGILIWLISTTIVLARVETQRTVRVRWEYKTVTSTMAQPASLNDYGDDGWELVTVSANGTEVIFKRQK